MLKARHWASGEEVDAADAEANARYVCLNPECEEDVVLKSGTKRRPHFAHKDGRPDCPLYDSRDADKAWNGDPGTALSLERVGDRWRILTIDRAVRFSISTTGDTSPVGQVGPDLRLATYEAPREAPMLFNAALSGTRVRRQETIVASGLYHLVDRTLPPFFNQAAEYVGAAQHGLSVWAVEFSRMNSVSLSDWLKDQGFHPKFTPVVLGPKAVGNIPGRVIVVPDNGRESILSISAPDCRVDISRSDLGVSIRIAGAPIDRVEVVVSSNCHTPVPSRSKCVVDTLGRLVEQEFQLALTQYVAWKLDSRTLGRQVEARCSKCKHTTMWFVEAMSFDRIIRGSCYECGTRVRPRPPIELLESSTVATRQDWCEHVSFLPLKAGTEAGTRRLRSKAFDGVQQFREIRRFELVTDPVLGDGYVLNVTNQWLDVQFWTGVWRAHA